MLKHYLLVKYLISVNIVKIILLVIICVMFVAE